jgi:hypothetical protein
MAGADPDTFDAAVDEARGEGNLSRANVVRKMRGESRSKGCGLTAPINIRPALSEGCSTRTRHYGDDPANSTDYLRVNERMFVNPAGFLAETT